MKRLAVIISLVATLGIASIAQAQATRTWVSGVGDDANPCSRTAPCKTFAGAISKTAPGGEIDVLDPGGFGAVTITKSIKIDGGPFAGGVLSSGVTGVLINAAATDTVTLRNLSINGTNNVAAVNGVRVFAAKSVVVDHCEIYGWGSRGISVETAAKVIVTDTVIRNNVSSGIFSSPASGTADLIVNDSKILLNGVNGIHVVANTNALVRGSTLVDNTSGGFVIENASCVATIETSYIARNNNGIQAGVAGQAPVVFLSRSVVTFNLSNGLLITGTSQVIGYLNNVVDANGGNSTVSSSRAQQ